MRNKYAGVCYRCFERCEPGAGHFEKHQGYWRVQHATCAIIHRTEATKKLRRELAKRSR